MHSNIIVYFCIALILVAIKSLQVSLGIRLGFVMSAQEIAQLQPVKIHSNYMSN